MATYRSNGRPGSAGRRSKRRSSPLEPSTYRPAQQIERSKRAVKLPDGQNAWEISLFDDVGILSVGSSFDGQNIRQRYQVHLRDGPERLALSATATVAKDNGKEHARP